MLPFQVRLQAETAQVDVPGIPAEKLKLTFNDGSRCRGDCSGKGRYPGNVITNMAAPIYNPVHYLYTVVVEKDVLMKKKKVAETWSNLFIEDMTKLLEDPETSDFTLKCGSKNFKVHKAILGARSNVFRTMFLSGMKEAVEGEAVITDVDEKTLEEILHYLYTGKLSSKEFAVRSLC